MRDRCNDTWLGALTGCTIFLLFTTFFEPEKLEIISPNGKYKAVLRAGDDGAYLELTGPDRLATVRVDEDATRLILHSDKSTRTLEAGWSKLELEDLPH